MPNQLSQALSTLRDIILVGSIKLGFMPWLTWLIRKYVQGNTHSEKFTDHDSSSTWYTWFDDNIDDFYTADPSSESQPLDPTDLVNSLLENKITLWHHPEFAPWLAALVEPALYQWPAEIPLDADLTQPEQVSSPETQQKLSQAFGSLPTKLVSKTHIQELVLMYLGASYPIIEQFSNTPAAQATAKERENYHQKHYAKQIEHHIDVNPTD